MSVVLKNLYSIYAELESLPEQAAKATKAAADKRHAAVASAERAQRDLADRHAKATAAARARQQSAHNDLEQRVKAAAQSANGKGVLPSGSANGRGGAPDFARFQEADGRLGAALDDKRKLEYQLGLLREQLERENGQADAKQRDKVSFMLLGVGAVLAIVLGANIMGAIVAIIFVTIAQIRIAKGPSAYVIRHAEKIPYVLHDRRIQSGIAQILAGWCLMGTLVVTSAVSRVLEQTHPFWDERSLWRWSPSPFFGNPGFEAYITWVLFWLAFGYALVLLIRGYTRRGGK